MRSRDWKFLDSVASFFSQIKWLKTNPTGKMRRLRLTRFLCVRQQSFVVSEDWFTGFIFIANTDWEDTKISNKNTFNSRDPSRHVFVKGPKNLISSNKKHSKMTAEIRCQIVCWIRTFCLKFHSTHAFLRKLDSKNLHGQISKIFTWLNQKWNLESYNAYISMVYGWEQWILKMFQK